VKPGRQHDDVGVAVDAVGGADTARGDFGDRIGDEVGVGGADRPVVASRHHLTLAQRLVVGFELGP